MHRLLQGFRGLVVGLSSAVVPAAAGLALVGAVPSALRAHGAAGGAELAPGAFQLSPVLTIEGHGGLENNLEGQPRHYAIDGLVGVVLEWGLPNKGSLAIEAMVGPALVWGEAEHFYGRVHVEDDHGHAPHGGDDHADDDHADDDHAEESHGHGSGAPWRRADVRGQLQVRYAPNERLSFTAEWQPYYVTRDQGDESEGFKHELGVGVVWALGDGDVNFALGDGLEAIADGVFVSVNNRTGWDSDGTYVGNYTDPWLGVGFNIDRLNVTLSGGPRFYSPGSYADLPDRTDWGGEVALEFPLSANTVLFAHWSPIYSSQEGEGWGRGWQHHVGTGVTFRF